MPATRTASVNTLLYMFFTWIAWPIWAPVSAYFLEYGARRNIILFS